MRSIITKFSSCIICGAMEDIHHHHLIGGSRRKLSDEDGLIVPLCSKHHNMSDLSVHLSPEMDAMSKIIGELAWERTFCAEGHTVDEARDAFRKRYGKTYI